MVNWLGSVVKGTSVPSGECFMSWGTTLLCYSDRFFFFPHYDPQIFRSDCYIPNHTPAKQRFLGVYWNQPVCPSLCISVYKILFSVKALAGVLTLSQTKNFRPFQTEIFFRRQFHIARKWQKVLQTGRKHCGKRRNC